MSTRANMYTTQNEVNIHNIPTYRTMYKQTK